MNMKDFRRARKRVEVSVGESVRIVRELQGLTQNGLSKLTGIPQSTISAIEHDSVNLGVERAKGSRASFKLSPGGARFSRLASRKGISGLAVRARNTMPRRRSPVPPRPALSSHARTFLEWPYTPEPYTSQTCCTSLWDSIQG